MALPIGPQQSPCRISEILGLLYTKSHFFHTHSPSLFLPKYQGIPLGVDIWWWGLWRANTPS